MGAVHLYVATSLDGFIADPADGLDWLFTDGDYGYEDFLAGVGTLVMGRRTYDVIRSFGAWPYPGRPCYVLTHRPADPEPPSECRFVAESAPGLLRRLAAEQGEVWLVGGGVVAGECLAQRAIDRLTLSVHPVLLGDGLPLFPRGVPGSTWKLERHEAFPNGLVQLVYGRVAGAD